MTSTLQAIQLVLQYAPTLTVDYCLTYLPPKLDPWRDLLDTLLDICTAHDREGNSANAQTVEVHRTLYKGSVANSAYYIVPYSRIISVGPLYSCISTARVL